MHTSQSLLKDFLNVTPFPGWDLNALYPHVSNKLSRLEFDLLFPHGTESLISEYQCHLHSLLKASILIIPENLGVTAKIRWLIRTHFENIIAHSDAEHAAIAALYHPSIAIHAPAYVGQLTDIIWRAAGDTSTDMNYYTKRGTLGVIYIATLMYWHVSNASIDDIMRFFDHRLNNLKTITNTTKKIPTPHNIMKNVKLLKSIFWDK